MTESTNITRMYTLKSVCDSYDAMLDKIEAYNFYGQKVDLAEYGLFQDSKAVMKTEKTRKGFVTISICTDKKRAWVLCEWMDKNGNKIGECKDYQYTGMHYCKEDSSLAIEIVPN